MNDEINKVALDLVERLMSLEPDPTSLEGKALNAVTDMIVEFEKKYDSAENDKV